MTKEEIDILWHRAMRLSIEDGDQFTRYRFAELVAEAERNRTWTQDHWTEYERSIAAAAKAEEREACAKVKAPNRRKLRPGRWVPLNEQQLLDEQQACFNEGWRDGVAFIRAAIRARGQA